MTLPYILFRIVGNGLRTVPGRRRNRERHIRLPQFVRTVQKGIP